MSTYLSKNPCLPRSGSQSQSARSFTFQTPKTLNADLNGNLQKKIHVPKSKEEVIFRKLKKKDEPNSTRTLIPTMAVRKILIKPEPHIRRSNSVRNVSSIYNPGSLDSLISKTESNESRFRRIPNQKVYNSFRFDDDSKTEPYKRNLKEGVFKIYDNTTQIVSLPGGVKRQLQEIKDESVNVPLKNLNSYSVKLNRDYNSNISCLPGKLVNIQDERRIIKERKFQTSDIFNQQPHNNFNCFNVSNRKVQTSNRIFGQSNNEKKLIPHPLAHRPNQIRDVFRSQISIV